MSDLTNYTNGQLVSIFKNAVLGPQGDGSWEPKVEQDARIEAARTELLRRLNKTDLEHFIEMLTRLDANFDSNVADAEELAMYEPYGKWLTLHTIVRVYPVKDTWPLGFDYCWSIWFFDKDGKLIAQGASE